MEVLKREIRILSPALPCPKNCAQKGPGCTTEAIKDCPLFFNLKGKIESKTEEKKDIIEAVCVTCRELRVDGEWGRKARKATKKEFKTLGRVFCPECRP